MPFVYIVVAVVAFIADRLTKNWAAGALRTEHGGSLPLIENVFHLTYCENRGAAFSMMEGQKWFLIGMTSLICLAGVYFLFFHKKKLPVFPSICIAMAIGGALGNLYDRILLGYVIDMLDFCLIHFAVFNVADSFVCVGVILLGVWMVFFEEKQMPLQPYRWGAPKAEIPVEPAMERIENEENNAHDSEKRDN